MTPFNVYATEERVPMDIPAMTTSVELSLYRDVATRYRGVGGAFEVGPWLGATTARICDGLAASGRPWTLHVCDRFEWTAGYERKSPLGLSPGDSFREHFLHNVHPWHEGLEVTTSTIADLSNVAGLPASIELLFVDAPKTWKTTAQLLQVLGPRLVPGATVLFQDFLHVPSHEIAWLTFSLEGLRPDQIVSDGCAATFRVDAPLDSLPTFLHEPLRHQSLQRLERAYRSAREAIPKSRFEGLHIAFAGLIWGRGERERGRRMLHDWSYEPARRHEAMRQIEKSARGARRHEARVAEFLLTELRAVGDA